MHHVTALIVAGALAVASPATRVADLNDAPIVEPRVPGVVGTLDGSIYFVAASDFFPLPAASHGLFRVDAVGSGATLIRDGLAGGSTGEWFLELDGHAVWHAGFQLGATDGTPVGTVVLAGGPRSVPVVFEDRVIVAIDDAATGDEPWLTDGTLEGTRVLKDIAAGSSSPRRFVALDDVVVFDADAGGGREPWITDGTEAGTVRLLDVAPGGTSSIHAGSPMPVRVGGRAYFVADDGVHGSEPWSTDGTPAGTTMLADLCAGSCSSDVRQLLAVGDTLYLSIAGAGGAEMWRSDGTAAGTERLVEIPGVSSSLRWTRAGSLLYATWHSSDVGRELRVWDGTTSPPRTLDLEPGAAGSSPEQLTAVGDVLYFVDAPRERLWATDGSVAGTRLLNDLLPAGALALQKLTAIGDDLYLLVWGYELWRTDGTVGGTTRVGAPDESAGWTQHAFGPSTGPREFVPLDSSVLFRCGGTACASDGTATGTGTLIPPQVIDAGRVGDTAVLLTRSDGLWTTDGTEDGSELLVELPDGETGERLVSDGAVAYVSTIDDFHRPWLWRTDGTASGTAPFASPDEVNPPFGVQSLAVVPLGDGVLLHDVHDVLRFTDGTAVGTVQLAEFEAPAARNGGGVGGFHSLGDGVIFQAMDPASGDEPWFTDGSVAGTYRIADLVPGTASSYPSAFASVGDGVTFHAGGSQWIVGDDPMAGAERIEGMTGATCAEIVTGTALCIARVDGAGDELWRTDGTTAGTELVAELMPGLTSGVDREAGLYALAGRALFAGRDPSGGVELWISDATPEGTRRVQDVWPGPRSSRPVVTGHTTTRVFFVATDEKGRELWTARIAILLGDARRGVHDLRIDTLVATCGEVSLTRHLELAARALDDGDPTNDHRAARALWAYRTELRHRFARVLGPEVTDDLARFADQVIELIGAERPGGGPPPLGERDRAGRLAR